MDFYFDTKPIERKVSEKELQELANNLNKFLTTYIKHIYIEDPQQIAYINKLADIVMYIKTRQYNQIFDNPLVIDYDLEEDPINYNSTSLPYSNDFEKYYNLFKDHMSTQKLPF
jgi:hypothetical protein